MENLLRFLRAVDRYVFSAPLVTVIFAAIIIAGSFYDAHGLKTRQCLVHKPEKLPNKIPIQLGTNEFFFHSYSVNHQQQSESRSGVVPRGAAGR